MEDFWIKNVFPNLEDYILCFWLNICDISAWNYANSIKQMIDLPTMRSGGLSIHYLGIPFYEKSLPEKNDMNTEIWVTVQPKPKLLFWKRPHWSCSTYFLSQLGWSNPATSYGRRGKTGTLRGSVCQESILYFGNTYLKLWLRIQLCW